ncbi:MULTISPECIES: SRPBCC family protein [Mycobacteriaceae]|uniref:ATPase n=1 Tax=Mycolicibacterium neoaurum VKM Ac-1815D TaxID=700508 RepID=V5XCC6_MYCNE|nr:MULTISPECIES: SRPBCC family protein [Mycobacteriaceae]AHC25662.1 ATPase [Mycolicibacterium neoaurum VKM Ac-1815D]AMO06099.1 ATPase [Mycolicibacterium neoaurum]AXK75558.1 ATPase [Mycolicibacterium neoaurum]KJQ50392.1 ATPase [Mycolicibacterium neoaurum]KUM09562.1 ATPase [Mycolicibacterium neoaurum]
MSDTAGDLIVDGDRATLRFDRWLAHPPATVWAALTEPAQRARWMGPTVIEPRVGGHIDMVPTDPPTPEVAKRMTGRITVWDPPHVLEHEWHQRIAEPGYVRYELHPENAGTRLVLTHRGLGVRNAGGFRPGTHAFLDRLAALLDGAPLPPWRHRYRQLAQTIYHGGDHHDV